MLPMIGVPTTAGTGSEAQSYAIISDPRTHKKMACGDPKAAFRAVILDPRLTLTQPPSVTAAAGYDAIAHAVESFVCTKRNPRSQELSLEAWRLLEANYERVLAAPDDLEARAAMQLGAFLRRDGDRALDAGRDARVREPGDRALRHHARQRHRDSAAARRPLERAASSEPMYAELLRMSDRTRPLHRMHPTHLTAALAVRLVELAAAGDLPRTLRDAGASSRRSAGARQRGRGAVDRHVQPAAVRCARARWRFTNARSDSLRVVSALGASGAVDRGCATADVVAAVSREPAAHRRRVIAASRRTLKVMWTFDAGEAIESSAAIADGAVYVGRPQES